MSLASGRRADLVALGADGEIWIVEIKSSVADFRADQKWMDYRLHCDRLFFATTIDVPCEIFPHDTGLIVADAFGAEIVCEAPEHRASCRDPQAHDARFRARAALRLVGARRSGRAIPVRKVTTEFGPQSERTIDLGAPLTRPFSSRAT